MAGRGAPRADAARTPRCRATAPITITITITITTTITTTITITCREDAEVPSDCSTLSAVTPGPSACALY